MKYHLEIRSISITRLKRSFGTLTLIIRHISWNQKYLDYEIETSYSIWKVRFAVPWNQKYLDYEIETSNNQTQMEAIQTWNQKYLDYEIETSKRVYKSNNWYTWNQKYLDYEIETWKCHFVSYLSMFLEIRSISITRLKPMITNSALNN